MDEQPYNEQPYTVDGPQAWRVDALCAQTDPELFFPETGGPVGPAKAVCARCPVTGECLEWALEHDERFGVWGGTSPQQRKALRRTRQGRTGRRPSGGAR